MIESTKNAAAKYLLGLKNKKDRQRDGVFTAEGLRFIDEIPSDYEVMQYAVSETFARQNGIETYGRRAKVTVFSDAVFQYISDTLSPQGILAVVRQKKYSVSEILSISKNPFFIVAEALNDPGNLGTIIRTADAVGADGLFLSKGSVDLYNSKVLRATMGSIFHIPIVQDAELEDIIPLFRERGIKTYAAHLRGKRPMYDFDLKGPSAVMIGNEANGLTERAASLCDELIKIPMPGQAESLNASVAAAVLMYEVVRQRM